MQQRVDEGRIAMAVAVVAWVMLELGWDAGCSSGEEGLSDQERRIGGAIEA
jgi:hypothetical protein